jgi:hypothetical protein
LGDLCTGVVVVPLLPVQAQNFLKSVRTRRKIPL